MLLYWNRCYSLALKGWPLALKSDSHFKALLQKKKKGGSLHPLSPFPHIAFSVALSKVFLQLCRESDWGTAPG